MTSKERIEAVLEGRKPDRIPFSPFLAYVWESFPKAVRDAGYAAFHKSIGADPLWRGAPCPVRLVSSPDVVSDNRREGDTQFFETRTPVGTLRWNSRLSPDGNTWFIQEHPLKTQEDYKILLWIEERYRFELDLTPVNNHLAGDGAEGLSLFMMLPFGKSAFQQLVEHYCGTVELQYALADFPETVDTLWHTMAANRTRCAELAAAATPCRWFLTWEDSSTQNYSPAQYDRYIGAEIRSWLKPLHAAGKKYVQHACGHVRDLVPLMKADGVDAVESLSPLPTGNLTLAEARSLAGPQFPIIGGIEPVHFLQLGDGAFDRYVEQVLEEGSRGGPLVLANSDSCPPGVTPERYARAAQICRAWKP
jgi:hypothetical protein